MRGWCWAAAAASLVGALDARQVSGADARSPAPAPAPAPAAAARRATSTCAQDDAIATPPDYAGWDRSAVVAWKGVEQYGGIVPDIEEDRGQAPPAWWRYPSAVRSAGLLAAEARDPKGLYATVAGGELKPGDLLVRTAGAGACGKMALVAGMLHDQWMTVEADGEGQTTRAANPMFFAEDGKTLRAEVVAYRVNVKKDDTQGHARELDRDLDHLERTIGERPPLLARNGRAAVDEKLHDLLDEAWSLIADPAFDLERRVLAGRALALAAALDWPGAAESAAAVLDDVMRRAPSRGEAVVARASVLLLAGQPDKAVTLSEAALAIPGVSPRARYVLGRALLAAGKRAQGVAALQAFLQDDPADPRARKLVASAGQQPALAPAASVDPAVRYTANADRAGLTSAPYDLHVEWPMPWRVLAQSVTPENGMLIDLATGRVLLETGDAERGGVVLLAQRPQSAAERAALVKKAGRNMFPEARLKTMPPLLPGSRREKFTERRQGVAHEGEVTTVQRGDLVYFLVLNASSKAYPKLKDEYATFVKSLTPANAPSPATK